MFSQINNIHNNYKKNYFWNKKAQKFKKIYNSQYKKKTEETDLVCKASVAQTGERSWGQCTLRQFCVKCDFELAIELKYELFVVCLLLKRQYNRHRREPMDAFQSPIRKKYIFGNCWKRPVYLFNFHCF